MTSSDIIAIIAVIVSAIVSIIAGIISYKNTKMSLEARRSEMAFEKRLDAFKDVVEQLGKIQFSLMNWSSTGIKDENEWKAFLAELKESSENFFSCFHRQIIFLPPNISELINAHALVMGENIGKIAKNGISQELLREWMLSNAKVESDLISRMQKFVGYK